MTPYIAIKHFVYYRRPDNGHPELFLSVHPTSADITECQQAVILADVLNKEFSRARSDDQTNSIADKSPRQ